ALCGTVEIRVGDLLINSEKTTSEAPEIERILALARQKDCGAAIVEVSAHALSLNRIDNIVFDVAAFTNLQHDHLDYYGDMESYFAAKKSLFTPVHSKQGVVCVDDEWGQRLARESEVPVTTVAVFSDHEADWKVRKVTFDRGIPAVTFDLETPQSHVRTIRMPMLGEVNVQNAVVALVSAVQMGTDFDAAVQALENAEQVPGRMTSVNPDPGNQPLVIVDFAHTPEGLEWTLKSVRELTRGKLVLVFGTDGDRDATKREPLAAIAAQLADVLWVTDENPRSEDASSIRRQLLSGIRSVRPDLENVTEVPTCRRDAVREAILAAQAGDIVVISGKGAEWYQEIRGIKHAYNDVPVAQEVLAQDIRARL
ncbi:Mur ligase family protein, partial [Actinomyces sp.]